MIIPREEVGVAAGQRERRKDRGQIRDPLPVNGGFVLRAWLPCRNDLDHEVLSTHAERCCIRSHSRARAVEVVQRDEGKV